MVVVAFMAVAEPAYAISTGFAGSAASRLVNASAACVMDPVSPLLA